MENLIKVQEEFEKLIGQLEKLKEINKLSSLNTETAQKVINQLDGFAIIVNDFKKKVDEDFEVKSTSANQLLKDLETGVEKIELTAKELSISVGSSIDHFKNEITISLNDYFNKFSYTIEANRTGINDNLNNIKEDLEKNQLLNLKRFRSTKIMIGLLYFLVIVLSFSIIYVLY